MIDGRMLERRISEKIFRAYFKEFEKPEKQKCPFCHKGQQFSLSNSIIEKRIYRGHCQHCGWVGGALELVADWHGVSYSDALEILRAFDKGGKSKFVAEIKKRTAPKPKSFLCPNLEKWEY